MSEWLKEHAWKSEPGERHQAASKCVNAHAMSDLATSNYYAVCVGKPPVFGGFEPDISQSYHHRIVCLAPVARKAAILRKTLAIYGAATRVRGDITLSLAGAILASPLPAIFGVGEFGTARTLSRNPESFG